ncbi:MAG TPA: hypothetical protein VGP80_14580 [Gemmatimonadales bacterium]|nr:hypothetical protein [Gemmatimonadales bacterium]
MAVSLIAPKQDGSLRGCDSSVSTHSRTLPGRVVAHVLAVAALEVGDPVGIGGLVEGPDATLHHPPSACLTTGGSLYWCAVM